MPKRPTTKVLERKKQILEILRNQGELPTSEIVRMTGLSHSQVFYTLRLLQKEGLVEEVKRGKVAYWRVREEALESSTRREKGEGTEEKVI
ncbi:MAG: DNA-binding protein [Thermoprotei archaeon]|nr:MAG: DNA-binding protein [Thermoprotei archaeon]